MMTYSIEKPQGYLLTSTQIRRDTFMMKTSITV